MFAHLHVHTEYSPLDGLAKIEELILKAKSLGQNAIAITDHGSTSGLYDAQQLGMKHDFKVLLGCEFYLEDPSDSKKNGHVILLAKDQQGLQNLFLLQAAAYQNFYYKPRISMDHLAKHKEGLVCTSACMANPIPRALLAGDIPLALAIAAEFERIFGEDFYMELQSTTMEEQHQVNKLILEHFKDAKFILTNDVHYVEEKDADVHEVLLCIQQKTKMSNPKRWSFSTRDYFLKSEEEMMVPVPYLSPVWERCKKNIEEIVDKCNAKLEPGNYLPSYMDMSKEEEDEFLAEQTMASYLTRIKERKEMNHDFLRDLQKEISVIKDTGYSGYFLIVQEYINWAKQNGILVGDGRGSGAGSKVAYTLGITEVNPQKHDLLFERFLSPGRQPDFDVDFSDIDAVYKHLQDLYGSDNVARVGAFNRFTCKSALRKVMGVYDFNQATITHVVGFLPQKLHFTMEEAMRESEDFYKWVGKNPDVAYVVAKLENILSHMSTHAGGVVICPGLTGKLPTMVDNKDKDKLVVAFDKIVVEALGHYKFDILGLISLEVIANTLKYLPKIDWHAVDFEDPAVYNILCNGDVAGVFQLSEQMDKVVEQQPRCFEDLIAINALIRPGVGDWNEYIRRRRECDDACYNTELSFLRPTMGIIVYQEQYLLLAQHYAGWDIAYSDKAIRKNKNICEDEPLKSKFMEDSLSKGFPSSEIEEVWQTICEVVSSGYGFNRSHSTSYAMLSFQTAYLKAYHPKEFYAAYLTAKSEDKAEIVKIQGLLRQLQIPLLPPDINGSSDTFIPTEEGIRYRLDAVNGVGGSALYDINKLKPITSLEDLKKRRTPKFIRSSTLVNLVKAGCFDFECPDRYALLKRLDESIPQASHAIYEKDSLGLYLSESPFDKYRITDHNVCQEGSQILTVGELIKVSPKFDKRGKEMAFITAMNTFGAMDLVVFSSVWKNYQPNEGDLVLIVGKKDRGSILVDRFEPLEV